MSNLRTGALRFVAVASAFAMSVSFAAPAFAQPLRDTSLDEGAVTLQSQPAAESSDNAMPDNPTVELPDKVAKSIPDNATVVSGDHAITADGKLKDIETGKTVTDPKLVGTTTEQPDPLAKTDGESFNPIEAKDVKTAVKDAGSADASNTASSSDSKTDGAVKPAALGNNEYGAHWGSYNGTQAFFDANNNLFVQQAKGVVDVSEWQHEINWQAAKDAGVEGAIIRIGYGWGNGFDKQALRNISELKRLGIPFGVYLYSYAYDNETAAKEGANVVNLLRKAGVGPADLSYPVYYDLEAWSWVGHAHPTDPNVYDGIVNAWYGQLQGAGYGNLSVYSYTNYLNGPLNSANIHSKTRWVAQYGATMHYTAWPSNDRGWQYTSGGAVNGIAGRVDLNAFGYSEYQSSIDVRKMAAISIPNGTYYINSVKKPSSSIEIAGGSMNSGTVTQLNAYNKSKAQQFTFTKQSNGSYVIQNANSGKVLDVESAVARLNAQVRQWDANDTTAQQWYIRDSGSGYYIQSALGNWVLDLSNGSTDNGARAALYAPNDTDAQKYSLASAGVSISTGSNVRIQSSKNDKMVMDIQGASAANKASVQLYSSNGSNAQQFRFTEVGNGVYTIQNVGSGKVIDLAGGKGGNKVPVQQYSSNGTAAQQWSVIANGNGYVFVSAKTAKAIDIPSGNAVIRAKLQTYTYNGTAAQQWSVK